MTDEVQQPDQSPAPAPAQVPAVQRPTRQYAIVESEDPLFDTARFDHMARVANALAQSTLLPEGLRKDGDRWLTLPELQANAFVVVGFAQSLKVQVMAVAQSMGMVHGKPVFEGKFIAAVIEARLGVKLQYEWFGEPGTPGYGIKVTTKQDAERGYHAISGTVADWRTKNKSGGFNDVWVGHKQTLQLAYRGAREWCRLNEPGLILGIYGGDEFDAPGVVHEVAPPPRISAGFAPGTVSIEATAEQMAKDRQAMDAALASKNGEREVYVVSTVEGRGGRMPADAHAEEDANRKPDGPGAEAEKATAAEAERARLQTEANAKVDRVHEVLGPKDTPAATGEALEGGSGGEPREAAPSGDAPAAPPPAPKPDKMDPEEILRPFLHVIGTLKDWPAIRKCLSSFAVMEDWKALGTADRARAKAGVWKHIEGLNWEAKEAGEPFVILPHQDLLAYNCALLACDSVEAIQFMWEELSDTGNDAWKAASEKARNQMKAATTARVVELQQAAS